MNRNCLYLDYNATSPLAASVLTWLASGDLLYANPASQHMAGKASRKLINDSRRFLYSTFSLKETDYELFFHSGATEGIVSFTYSFCEWARREKKRLLICTSSIDHSATSSLKERYWGEHVEFYDLKLKNDLSYDHASNLAALQEYKQENPESLILYHHLWVHNETGLISSLDALSELKNIEGLFLHIDGVQAPGKIRNWQTLTNGDMFTFSAHKFGSLKGIGFSFFTKKMKYFPLLTGGGQQKDLRSGTENVLGVYSVKLALEDLLKVDIDETYRFKDEIKTFLIHELEGLGGVLEVAPSNSNTIYFYLNHLTSDISLALFDLHGLMISAGSACSSGTAKPSSVLREAHLNSVARNGLRMSLNFAMTAEEVLKIKEQLALVFAKIRSTVGRF